MPGSDMIVKWPIWSAVNTRLQTYADAIDRADLAGILAGFSPDGIWDYRPGEPLQGHAAIGEFFSHLDGFAKTSHHVGPPVVLPGDTRGSFQSTAYFIARHLLRAGGTYTVHGRYIDRFVGPQMLIAYRRVVAHVTEGTERTYHLLERGHPS